jgi:hypothetical protein
MRNKYENLLYESSGEKSKPKRGTVELERELELMNSKCTVLEERIQLSTSDYAREIAKLKSTITEQNAEILTSTQDPWSQSKGLVFYNNFLV